MYFPKSQIKPNLYTSGKETITLYLDRFYQQVYSGYYYEISNGKKYTGRTPGDGQNILLYERPKNFAALDPTNGPYETEHPKNGLVEVVIETVPTDDDGNPIDGEQLNEKYLRIQGDRTSLPKLIPTSNLTFPTPQDYKNGKMLRYFAKKTNELRYLEISKQTFQLLNSRDNRILWSLYEPVQLQWIISGFEKQQVNDYNTIIVKDVERKKKWNGFSKFLKEDYTKYYKNLSA